MPCRRDLLSVLKVVAHEEDAARPRVNRVTWGKPRGVKRPACYHSRPARVEAVARLRDSHAADMSNRPERKTHSDRLAEDEAQVALRPLGPANEAINPDRQTNARCAKRSTPPAGLDRGRRRFVNSVDSARAACEGPTSNSALAAFPLGLSPCNRDHAPRLSMVGNRGESQTLLPFLPDPFGAVYAPEAIRNKSDYLFGINSA